ncbi:MAG: phage head-tail adapter protein [Clostridia bacterium]|nr:phage head-tail adapter protein [Clostridia bacterium]
MARADVITLIAESPEARGIYDNPETTERTVFVTVRSVGMTETYTAMSQGLRPEVKFELAAPEEYQGEAVCRYHGKLYTILRTYETEEKVELVAGRSNAHV